MHLLFRYGLYCVAIYLMSKYLTGFSITSGAIWKTVLVVSLLVLLIDLIVKPVISFFTLPINILTLGIFSLVVNAFLLWGVAWYVDGFEIVRLSSAFIAALVLSIINHLFGYSK